MIHPHLGINADSDKGCHMEVVDHFEMMFTTKKTAFYVSEISIPKTVDARHCMARILQRRSLHDRFIKTPLIKSSRSKE